MKTRKVTLSFDDGPTPDVTPVVLDVLAKHEVKSSFFSICSKLDVSNDRGAAGREIARRAVAEGHWYGSHSYYHQTPLGWMKNFDDAISEIDLSIAALSDLATPEIMYRPFGLGGVLDTRLFNPIAVKHLLSKGYKCVLWDFTPREWDNVDDWVDACLVHCRGEDWTCISLRDSEPTIGRQLDSLIVALREEGFEIVQDYPEHAVVMRNGIVTRDISSYVAGGHAWPGIS